MRQNDDLSDFYEEPSSVVESRPTPVNSRLPPKASKPKALSTRNEAKASSRVQIDPSEAHLGEH